MCAACLHSGFVATQPTTEYKRTNFNDLYITLRNWREIFMCSLRIVAGIDGVYNGLHLYDRPLWGFIDTAHVFSYMSNFILYVIPFIALKGAIL